MLAATRQPGEREGFDLIRLDPECGAGHERARRDGAGQGGDFEDAHALATSTQVWEHVVAEAKVGPSTTAIKVRGVRDGANLGNAYFDAITLQRVD